LTFKFFSGIRNALIGDFRNLTQRTDGGALLENAVIMGVIRGISYHQPLSEVYFWRNYDGKEVDLLIINPKKTLAIEVKLSSFKAKIPKGFNKTFPKANCQIVSLADAYRFCW
jgi:predicted AAA+ superfamily ATPase